MIDELSVRNVGIVATARLCPSPGLTVLTGETGAGKTIVVGALRILAGGDGHTDLVGSAGEEAVVEVRLIDEEEHVLSRKLQRGGRGRSYIDGNLASARALGALLPEHVEIVGQHDQLSLTRPSQVLALIDGALDKAGAKVRGDVRQLQARQRELLSAIERTGGDSRALERELDLVRYQAAEIHRAGFQAGEDEELERRATRMHNSASLIELLSAAVTGLEAVNERWGAVTANLRSASRHDPDLEDLVTRWALTGESHVELGREVRNHLETIEVNPQERELVEGRLTLLGELKRKYGRDLEEVLAFGKEAARRAEEIESLLSASGNRDQELSETEARISKLSGPLAEKRRKAGQRLAAEALDHLRDLGFKDPSLFFELEDESVALLFASDSRLNPGPVERVASGGELSRLVLALRLAAGTDRSKSVVFDEIDSGIGGITALAMGRKLAALARERQVMCVTHLPQVAAFADVHYRLVRGDDGAVLDLVSGDERVAELSRMLAGLPESARGRDAAAELLALAAAENQL